MGALKIPLVPNKVEWLDFPYYVFFTKLNWVFLLANTPCLRIYYVATIGCLLMFKNRHRDLAFLIKKKLILSTEGSVNMSDVKSTLMIQHSKHAVNIFPEFLPLIADERKPFISVRLLHSRILQNIVYVHFRNIG